jgi:hypothetical protein
VRPPSAASIRAAGGSVEYNPEFDPRVGKVNYQHVDVCLVSCPRDSFKKW